MARKYFPGYEESRQRVERMTGDQLRDLMGSLYGIPEDSHEMSMDELLTEAIRQHADDWRIPERHCHFYE